GLDGADTKALGINGLGQACGVITESTGAEHGAIWMPGQPGSGLATLGGGASVARAINDLAQVVGDSNDASGNRRGFIVDPLATPGLHPLALPGGAIATDVPSSAATLTALFPAPAGTVFVTGKMQPSPASSDHAFVWETS